eukprot:scaffold129904_cov20-Tisochrysis_lutea.AAC.2
MQQITLYSRLDWLAMSSGCVLLAALAALLPALHVPSPLNVHEAERSIPCSVVFAPCPKCLSTLTISLNLLSEGGGYGGGGYGGTRGGGIREPPTRTSILLRNVSDRVR